MPKWIIMDGGGIDCLSSGGSKCSTCANTFKTLLGKMGTAGVKEVIYTRYPEPGSPPGSNASLKACLDGTMPMMQTTCEGLTSPKCHWVDLRPVWQTGDVLSDGLHPTPVGWKPRRRPGLVRDDEGVLRPVTMRIRCLARMITTMVTIAMLAVPGCGGSTTTPPPEAFVDLTAPGTIWARRTSRMTSRSATGPWSTRTARGCGHRTGPSRRTTTRFITFKSPSTREPERTFRSARA